MFVFVAIAGCESPPPYVFSADEFDRESEIYLKGVRDRDEVAVCYAKDSSTPRAVTELAVRECALFNKKAVFREQSINVCPLVTPMAAIYDCVAQVSSGGFNRPLK